MCDLRNPVYISEGSFGRVYFIEKDDEKYALKIYKNFEIKKMFEFLHEIDIMFNIRQQNLIRGRDIFKLEKCNLLFEETESEDVGILMDLIPGGTLSSLTNIDFKTIYQCLIDVTLATQCLIDKNYFHLDIKPKNILYLENKNKFKFYLADYGLMSPIRDEFDTIYTGKGTPKFMSPDRLVKNTISVQGLAYTIILSILVAYTEYTWKSGNVFLIYNIPKLTALVNDKLDKADKFSSKSDKVKISIFREIANSLNFFSNEKNIYRDYVNNFNLTPRKILDLFSVDLNDCRVSNKPAIISNISDEQLDYFFEKCEGLMYSTTCLALTLYLRLGYIEIATSIASQFFNDTKIDIEEFDLLYILKKLDYIIYDNDLYLNAPSEKELLLILRMPAIDIVKFINGGCCYPDKSSRYLIDGIFHYDDLY